jgi:hypothetical protein
LFHKGYLKDLLKKSKSKIINSTKEPTQEDKYQDLINEISEIFQQSIDLHTGMVDKDMFYELIYDLKTRHKGQETINGTYNFEIGNIQTREHTLALLRFLLPSHITIKYDEVSEQTMNLIKMGLLKKID